MTVYCWRTPRTRKWATLLLHSRNRRFSPGDAIVTAGAGAESLYLVLEGQLEVLAQAAGRGRRGYRRLAWSARAA